MKEIIRIEKGYLGDELQHYNLSLFQGEIVYIQSISEQSIRALIDVLCGNRRLEQGNLFVDGEPAREFNGASAAKAGIYPVTFGNEFDGQISVAENLEPLKPIYSLYSKHKIVRHIRGCLREEKIEIEPETPVWELSDVDKKCLGVLKAKLYNARVVILDLRSEIFEGIGVEKLVEMIDKLRTDGMTFLILSAAFSEPARCADRIQYLYQGRALKEWDGWDDALKEKLQCGNLFLTKKMDDTERRLIGLYDYEVDLSSNFWLQLTMLRQNNLQIWQRCIMAQIPKYGEAAAGGTVIIPKNSQNLLPEDLNIRENLTIAAKKRISFGREGFILKHLEKRLTDTFYREHQIPPDAVHLFQLSGLQRKILSIARWEITKPETMILELPYRGLTMEEIPVLRSYLLHLAQKGIRVIYFSKSMETMQEDCRLIIRTQNGMRAKIDTF